MHRFVEPHFGVVLQRLRVWEGVVERPVTTAHNDTGIQRWRAVITAHQSAAHY